jgi:uncharacterized protein
MTSFSDRMLDLVRPSAFAHPAADIRLIETHISWVILAGDFAYKIRKPVNFGFLDFSHVEQRRADCEAEVDLNRRLCPDLYVGVVDVVERDDGLLYMAGPGSPVEPVVKMRRLPEQGMLPTLLERGEGDQRLMQRIASTLCAFHSAAATGEGVDEYGSLETIRTNWAENFTQTRDSVLLDSDKRAAIQAHVNQFLSDNVHLFEHRIADGRIRDGHGDLHAASVCSTRRQLYLFDCIEFNRRFRCADVAAEVAFLAMDLEHLGRTDLATTFVDAYVRCSGDIELPSLLDFYKCYRAFVRGKVRAFRLAEGRIDRAAETIGTEARAYFDLAYAYACPVKQPLLIVVMGLPASGKTTLARALAGRLAFVHLSSDAARKQLVGLRPTTHRTDAFETGLYTRAMTRRTYSSLRRQAARWLRRRRSVILDATYSLPAERAAIRRLGRRMRARTYFIVCTAQDPVLQARLAARLSDAAATSDARPELWPALHSAYVPPSELPDATYVDTSHAVGDLLAQLVAEIRQVGGDRTQGYAGVRNI